jgi:hypothetical protein
MGNRIIWIVVVSATLLISCNNKNSSQQEREVYLYQNSVDIEYGSDICSFDGEVIETVRYGGKITMIDGEVHKFMSVECVAGFVLGQQDKSQIELIEIVDFAHGQQYLPADQLVYLRSQLRPSPNGMNLTAIDDSNERMKTYIYDAYPGEFFNWEEVLELVKNEWNLAVTAMK